MINPFLFLKLMSSRNNLEILLSIDHEKILRIFQKKIECFFIKYLIEPYINNKNI